MAGASEAGEVVKAKFSFSKKDNKRQNDYCLGGEIWKNVPNTDFAYYSTHGRFSSSKDVGFPEMDAFYVLKMSLKKKLMSGQTLIILVKISLLYGWLRQRRAKKNNF